MNVLISCCKFRGEVCFVYCLLAQHSLFINFSCLTSSLTVNDSRAKNYLWSFTPPSWIISFLGGSLEGKLFHKTTCLQNANSCEKKHLMIKKEKLSGNSVCGFWGFFGGFFFGGGGGRGLRRNWVCLCVCMCVNKPRQFSNDLQERLYYVHISWNSVVWRSHIRKSWMTSWAQMKTACFDILTYWVHYFVRICIS